LDLLAIAPTRTGYAGLGSFTLGRPVSGDLQLSVVVPQASGSATAALPWRPGSSYGFDLTVTDFRATGTGMVTADQQFFSFYGSAVSTSASGVCGATTRPGGCSFLLAGGVPTPSAGVPTSGVSTYTLTGFGTSVPFAPNSLLNLPSNPSGV